jgi:hypothetical protein
MKTSSNKHRSGTHRRHPWPWIRACHRWAGIEGTTSSNRSPSSHSRQHSLPSAFEAKEATDFNEEEAHQPKTPKQTSTSSPMTPEQSTTEASKSLRVLILGPRRCHRLADADQKPNPRELKLQDPKLHPPTAADPRSSPPTVSLEANGGEEDHMSHRRGDLTPLWSGGAEEKRREDRVGWRTSGLSFVQSVTKFLDDWGGCQLQWPHFYKHLCRPHEKWIISNQIAMTINNVL